MYMYRAVHLSTEKSDRVSNRRLETRLRPGAYCTREPKCTQVSGRPGACLCMVDGSLGGEASFDPQHLT